MPVKRILILGGTRDARVLAAALLADGFDVITSLAGVTEHPVLPVGQIRRGGFGGAAGLARWLQAEDISLIIDATHPFAAQMSAHAAEAAASLRLPLLRLERPGWTKAAADRWIEVGSAAEALAALPQAARPLVTIGRKEIAPFFARADLSGVARMIEPPGVAVPESWTLLRERPPFSVEQEQHLITRHAITHLVTKNAGGDDTAAKIHAARALSLAVVMIGRPVKPPCPAFATVDDIRPAVRRALLP